jgi:hypothetical protein
MVFFSKDMKSAKEHLGRIAKGDGSYDESFPALAERQIPHIKNWKTFEIKRR